MRTVLLFLIIFSNTLLYAQRDLDEIDWENEGVGFACWAEGSQTKVVEAYLKLIENKKHKRIRKNLNSEVPTEQFLSLVAIDILIQKQEITLTEDEKLKIAEITNSKSKVPFCSGCSFWVEIPLNEVLDPIKKHIFFV